jgi:predicted TIM-barrel fold metal-dependent hydrolase
MQREGFDPEGLRLPIKLDSTSNGEYLPRPLSAAAKAANRHALEQATLIAKKLGVSRRRFLTSACGAAATLLAMNQAFAHWGKRGGSYQIAGDAAFEPQLAQAAVSGEEFIFDVQGHHVNPKGAWRRPDAQWEYILKFFPQSHCGNNDNDAVACFSAEHFIREVFLDSDTRLAVLSMVPAAPADNPLSLEDAAATRAMVDAMEGAHRLLLHGLVHPKLPGSIETMPEQLERYQISAWKTYTQWGPDGIGYRLDDPAVGIPFIEQARALGVKVICIHKGLPISDQGYEFSTCDDIGVVARLYPDMTFIVYHSGYDPQRGEGAYDPATPGGADALIKSLQDNNIAANSNVYAELGSTWRLVMQDPDQAAHLLGKLLKHVGENNVLWGTDSIWYGSPQDQIQAFRAFQIAEELRDQYAYPEITPEIRAKVFGLNAAKPYRLSTDEIELRLARDRVNSVRQAYLEQPDPSFTTNGPRTRREFMRLWALHQGMP